jgi:hypothetical protein
MADDRDMAGILDGLAARLKDKSMFLSSVEAGEGAAEIRRLRARVADLEACIGGLYPRADRGAGPGGRGAGDEG